jgi:lysozyme
MQALQVIQLNSANAAVKNWQLFLISRGYNVGAAGADGIFGHDTFNATVTFQQSQHLPADGVVGNQTYGAAMLLGFNGVLNIASFTGIDVYHDDGNIDWQKVAADPQNIQFAYIKATEGTTIQDPNYNFNIAQATAAGLKTGAYHFFSLTSAPDTQAQNFINTVGQNYNYALPPALDFEKDVSGGDVADTVAALQKWLTLIKNQWNITPIIYTSPGYWNQLNAPKGFDNFPLWLADYNPIPAMPNGDWTEWAIWQYCEKGTVQGIGSGVDLNRYNLNSGLM